MLLSLHVPSLRSKIAAGLLALESEATAGLSQGPPQHDGTPL